MSDALRSNVRGLAHQLAAPQGFTLSIAGTLAISIARHPAPRASAIWLFVLGAGVAFCISALVVGAHRESMTMPVSFLGIALLNLVPVAVVPVAAAAGWWIHNDRVALLVSGTSAVIAYVWGLAAFLVLAGSREEPG